MIGNGGEPLTSEQLAVNERIMKEHLNRTMDAIIISMFSRSVPQPQKIPFSLSAIKTWAIHSRHGIAGFNDLTFLSMGCVKECNEPIDWDAEAMARGEAWETRPRPWQESLR